jgi:DNA (cytosine-5)-methyltransferase 1
MAIQPISVVDLFAGPGGLAEGFSRVIDDDGLRVFNIVLSVEKEASAHKTLRLRAFLRQFGRSYPNDYYDWLHKGGDEPNWAELFPTQWATACEEAQRLTLGEPSSDEVLWPKLDAIKATHGGNTIVIGGPPCQAYSLVGRARNSGRNDYVFEQDERHALYQTYVQVLSRLQPAVFVMENVKVLIVAEK